MDAPGYRILRIFTNLLKLAENNCGNGAPILFSEIGFCMASCSYICMYVCMYV